jgi:hypothetical protein
MVARLRGALVLAAAAGAGVFFARLATVGEEETRVLSLTAASGGETICIAITPDAAAPDAGGLRVQAVVSRVPVDVDFHRSTLRFREPPRHQIGFPSSPGLLLVGAGRAVAARRFAPGRDLARKLLELAPDPGDPGAARPVSFDDLRRLLELADPRLRRFWE